MLGVSKAFPGVRALDHVDFRVEAGEVHALMGENGAGKSTLIKIMTGAVRRDEGEIRIDGRPVEIGSPGEARALGHRHGLSRGQSDPDHVGDQELDAWPPAAPVRADILAHGAQPRPRAAQAAQDRHRRRAAARLLFVGDPATGRDRARARGRYAGPGARRADRQPRRRRDRASVPDPARPESAAGSRSSSSPTSSTRSTRSPIASRCCATAASSAKARPRSFRG